MSDSELYFHDGPDADPRVPGEAVVKLSPEIERTMTESIPSGPVRALDFGVSRFGIDPLDAILSQANVASVTRVHAPIPESVIAAADLGQVSADISATYRVRLAPGADLEPLLERLAAVDAVVEASPNLYRWALAAPSDPMFGLQWGLLRIDAPSAWAVTVGAQAVIVAVIDTGVDLDHPDLHGNLVPGHDLVDLVGVTPPPGTRFEGDFIGVDFSPDDEVGHGTHVAGTIAATWNNFMGVAGVAPGCRMMPVRVLGRVVRLSDGRVTGSGTAVDIAAGIRWAVDHGARILNLSLGGYSDTFVERDAVAYAVARGALVIAAMGNDNTGQPSFPAAYPDVVAVGATDQQDRRATFSNFGSHIDVAGPGVQIRSTDWDNVYSDKSGTSMATPHVAGVAALVQSVAPQLTAGEIADILRETAQPLRDAPSDPVPNDRYGFGLVNAAAAVNRAVAPPPCRPPCPPCRPCRPPCRPCPPPCPPCRPCLPPCRPCLPPCRPCLPPCRPCLPPCRPCFPPCRPCFPPCRPCQPPPPPCFFPGATAQGYGYGGWEGGAQGWSTGPQQQPADAEAVENEKAEAREPEDAKPVKKRSATPAKGGTGAQSGRDATSESAS
jgi:subtilisin family serine protease